MPPRTQSRPPAAGTRTHLLSAECPQAILTKFQSALRLMFGILAIALSLVPLSQAQVTLITSGQPQSVILTKPSPAGYVQLAAQELQTHLQRMSGALVPIDVVGSEGSYPGKKFIYVGASTATTAAGISTTALTTEFYVIRTLNSNLYIVGRDAGADVWHDLNSCQPGTMFGVYHLLNEILGVRWLWPGETGIVAPAMSTVVVPDTNVTTGPPMVQRKYRTPRIGLYLGGATTYGFGVPVLPTDAARRNELALEELLWLRRMRMGTRKNPSFGHSFTQWWTTYGITHPEYFAELLPGRTQPHPAVDRVKLHVSSPAVWQQRVDDWVAAGAGTSLNICPNDSRSHCVCSSCLAWDRPAQAPEVVFSDSAARLGDRYARFYTEIANRVKLINPNTTVYGYAYDTYQNAPLEATVPDNVALAYIPGAPSATRLDLIAETESNVLGWIAHGCQQMYLRPNWMLSGHCGPFWPTRRVGEHFKRMLAGGYLKGMDSDSSCSSYASFGLYHYLICRLMANPSLTVDAILDEYCSGFGSAAGRVRDYFSFWENFIYNQADAGNTEILGWSTCMAAYGTTYSDAAFAGALQILEDAYALLTPAETTARTRLDFLRTACVHGRLTAQAIALVDPVLALSANPKAEKAMRSLLAYRNANAESFAIWREWMIDRESFVPNMESYWTSILATPGVGNGSNVGAFIESAGQVVMEAENFTSSSAGTGAAAGITWQQTSAISGASGIAMQALPNPGVGTGTQTNGPRLDFKIDFRITGTYFLFIHLPTAAGSDDSINVGLNGTLVASDLGNTTGSWRWRTTNPTSIGLNISTPGVHTFNIWMREDGVIVDKIILTTNPAFTLPGTDLGPAESPRRGTIERLLTVENGTGDGFYGEATLVPITANPAPSGYVFHRWTGATSIVTNILSPSTYATVPTADAQVTAIYKLDPALDTDGDGILDSWEISQFGNLTTADISTSDFDQDGTSDRHEFLAGTNPQDSASEFRVVDTSVSFSGSLRRITVQWPGVIGKTYRLVSTANLKSARWTPIAIGIPGVVPLTTYSADFPGSAGYLRVEVE